MRGLLLHGFLRAFFALSRRRSSAMASAVQVKWGMPVLVRNGESTPCVACHLCSAACPVDCIHVEAGPDPTGANERYPKLFSIDLGRCLFCGLCVQACPQDALEMQQRSGLTRRGASAVLGVVESGTEAV
jgi:NADH-quinone oxidoreductase subunit I